MHRVQMKQPKLKPVPIGVATIQDGLYIGDQLNTEINQYSRFKQSSKLKSGKKNYKIFSKGKTQTIMLPSNFRRTSTHNLLDNPFAKDTFTD